MPSPMMKMMLRTGFSSIHTPAAGASSIFSVDVSKLTTTLWLQESKTVVKDSNSIDRVNFIFIRYYLRDELEGLEDLEELDDPNELWLLPPNELLLREGE